MRLPRAGDAELYRHAGFACAAMAGAGLAYFAFRDIAEHGLFDYGIVYALSAFDLALPLLGVGLAWAQLGRGDVVLQAALLGAGFACGALAKDFLLRALLSQAGSSHLLSALGLVGPACCIACAIGLLLPDRFRRWVMPFVAGPAGFGFGFLEAVDDPQMGPLFAIGAVAAAIWLLSAPTLLLWWTPRPWVDIGGRIFAGWLVAIGSLLLATQWLARDESLPGPASPSVSPPYWSNGSSEGPESGSPGFRFEAPQ